MVVIIIIIIIIVIIIRGDCKPLSKVIVLADNGYFKTIRKQC